NSEPARKLLARHASHLGQTLASFDELAREADRSGPPVITHGEPHPDNILRSASRLYLIDWDTAGLALPERDLWGVAGADSCEAGRYTELTGRRVSTAVCACTGCAGAWTRSCSACVNSARSE